MGAIQSLALYPKGYPLNQLTSSQLPENAVRVLENETNRGEAPTKQQGIEQGCEAG